MTMTIEEQETKQLCINSWNLLVKTSTANLKVGDIITTGGFRGSNTKFYEVERFTNHYIIFKLCNTQEHMGFYKKLVNGYTDTMKRKKNTQLEYLVNDKTKPMWSLR